MRTYAPDVEYEFDVNGESFTGHRISWASINTSRPRDAEQKADALKVGQEVTVFHDPENPRDCALSTDLAPLPLVLFFLVAVAFLIGGILGFAGVFDLA